jgi:Trypsin-like peptidase domain/Colicin V production protein
MSWVDIVIVVWVVLAAVRGRALGALTQVLGLVGFVVGLAIGAAIAVPVAARFHVGVARTGLIAGIVLGVAVLAAIGGNVLGKWANVAMRRLRLGSIDALAGAAVAALGALLSAWLVAGLFTQSSVNWLAGPIQRSAVLTAIDAVMPPVPAVVARAEAFLSTDVFPVAFAEVTQPTTTSVKVPSQAAADALARSATRSVLKVEASGGCGEQRDGTSFVIAPGLVITDAHVVAGEPALRVVTTTGTRTAQLVVFDPKLDVAILRVPGLTSPSVRLVDATATVGTPGAIVGYPGGGPQTSQPAGVAGALSAQGRDIYGGGLVTRPIYAVTADVRPGNSGSPLVVRGGAAGMVFSRSLAQGNLGYAIRSSALGADLHLAERTSGTVGNGACTPG